MEENDMDLEELLQEIKSDCLTEENPQQPGTGAVPIFKAAKEETAIPAERTPAPEAPIKTGAKSFTDADLPIYMLVLRDMARIFVLVSLVFTFGVRLISVHGNSMLPTLQDGNILLLESNFLDSDYAQGDVVVAVSEDYDASRPLIKRVIAVEGQTVDIDFITGSVYVDGELLQEDYINELTTTDLKGFEYPVTVPEDCLFLMGDNRNNSTDSRDARVGFVSTEQILGKAFFRISPLDKIGGLQ